MGISKIFSEKSAVGVSRGLQLRDSVPLGLDGPNTNLVGVDSFNSADGKSGQLGRGTKKTKKLKLKPAGSRICWDRMFLTLWSRGREIPK